MPALTPDDLASLPQQQAPLGIKVIGYFKLVSSVLLVGLGYGIYHRIGPDFGQQMIDVIAALKLDPRNRIIHRAMEAISGVTEHQLYLVSAGTFTYAVLYAIEGIGLVLHKRWGEYVTIFITGSLIPFEAYEVFRKPTALRLLILALNAAIVAYLVLQLRKSHRAEAALRKIPEATVVPPKG